jgi:hypothetical protein
LAVNVTIDGLKAQQKQYLQPDQRESHCGDGETGARPKAILPGRQPADESSEHEYSYPDRSNETAKR